MLAQILSTGQGTFEAHDVTVNDVSLITQNSGSISIDSCKDEGKIKKQAGGGPIRISCEARKIHDLPELQFSSVFGNYAVLQRDVKAAVYGDGAQVAHFF